MSGWFNDDWRKKFLQSIATWVGTPYRHMGKVKGREIDCSLFIGFVWMEIGIIKKYDIDEYYPRDWYFHSTNDFILEKYIENEKYLNHGLKFKVIERAIPKDELFFGDVLGFKTKNALVTNHCCFYLGENKIAHALPHRGVCITTYMDWWERHLTNVIRLSEEK